MIVSSINIVEPEIIVDKDWWRGAVIYQVYPRSYQDSNGDGIGDLGGIKDRLDHIAELGADAVWISPFFKSPMKDFGYDVSNYKDIDPMFGDLHTFDELIEHAHALRQSLQLSGASVRQESAGEHQVPETLSCRAG